jgi:hypothetical protein
MDWIESQINDESLFPVTTDIPFPKAATYTYCNIGDEITDFGQCSGFIEVGPVTF